MKKIILILAALAAVFVARGDEKSDKVLKNVASTLAGYGSYEVKFTVAVKGSGSMSGSYTVSGNKYNIALQQQSQFSDGVNRYEIYPSDKEVVIDKADTKSHNILNNPTKAFEFLPSEFTSVWKGPRQAGGVNTNAISLTPRNSKSDQGVITLCVGVSSGLPVVVEYNYQGETITIKIDRITPLKSVNNALFTFDAVKYKGYEIIDFR